MTDEKEHYLKCKECISLSIDCGMVLEMNENLNVFERDVITKTMTLLTQMFIQDYVRLRDKYEPRNVQVNKGLRWNDGKQNTE